MPSDDSCDPDEGEPDVLEMISGQGVGYATYHYETTWPTQTCQYPKGHLEVTNNVTLPFWNSTYHEFAMERSSDYIAFVYDGVTILNSSGMSPPPLLWDMPFYLIMNTAVGGGWPGPVRVGATRGGRWVAWAGACGGHVRWAVGGLGRCVLGPCAVGGVWPGPVRVGARAVGGHTRARAHTANTRHVAARRVRRGLRVCGSAQCGSAQRRSGAAGMKRGRQSNRPTHSDNTRSPRNSRLHPGLQPLVLPHEHIRVRRNVHEDRHLHAAPRARAHPPCAAAALHTPAPAPTRASRT